MLPRKSLLPRKRFRRAFYTAWASSIAAVVFAVAPAFSGSAEYDAALAVLTATLVSLIWYTYFTYQAVNNSPPTMLDFGLGYQSRPATLSLSIQNQRHHHVTCIISFQIFTQNGIWPIPAPYTGRTDDEFLLKPGEAFHGKLDVADLVSSLPLTRRSVVVTARGTWKDETGEDGIAGPKSWALGLEDQSMRRLYSSSELEAEKKRILQDAEAMVAAEQSAASDARNANP